MSQGKIGEGHLAAWGRAGFKEVEPALVALPQSNIRPVQEPGLVGNLTPQEVVDAKTDYAARLDAASDRGVHGRQLPERGMER